MKYLKNLFAEIDVSLKEKNKDRNFDLLLKLTDFKDNLPPGDYELIKSLSVLVFDRTLINLENYLNLVCNTHSSLYFIIALHEEVFLQRENFSTDYFKYLMTAFLKLYKSRNDIREKIKNLYICSLFLGYKSKFSREYFLELILPIFKCEIKTDINSALLIEQMLYHSYVKSNESEDVFSFFYSQINKIYEDNNYANLNYSGQLIPNYELVPTSKKRILFIIHIANMLAHVEVLFSLLKGLKKIDDCEYQPILVFLFGYNLDIDNFLSNNGIEVVFLSNLFGNDKLIYERFIFIRELNLNHNILYSVVLSAVVWMACIFTLRISNFQIWYSMKFHSYNLKNIDLYLTGGAENEKYKLINSRNWSTVHAGLINLFDPALELQAISIKNSLKNWDCILGCFGREEKLRNPKYLKLITTILKNNKNCIFLWAAKNNDEFISNFFKENEIINQTLFIGWVNTKLYAQVIDIYLDCFPVPSGLTIYQAMAASVPFVTHSLVKGSLGIQANINSLYLFNNQSKNKNSIFYDEEYENLYLYAENDLEYIQYTEKLIHDKFFRKKVGLASKDFIDKHMSDNKIFAIAFIDHIKKMS